MYRTKFANKNTITKKWVEVEATDQVVGRLASRIAIVLLGKHKTDYTQHCDNGDFVIVTNAEKARFTGNKEDQKVYQSYSGYPGGQKNVPVAKIREKFPERILEKAVKRMLPKNKLGAKIYKNLKVYQGDQHPHMAQQSTPLDELPFFKSRQK